MLMQSQATGNMITVQDSELWDSRHRSSEGKQGLRLSSFSQEQFPWQVIIIMTAHLLSSNLLAFCQVNLEYILQQCFALLSSIDCPFASKWCLLSQDDC